MKKKKTPEANKTGHVKIWLRNDMPVLTFHGRWKQITRLKKWDGRK